VSATKSSDGYVRELVETFFFYKTLSSKREFVKIEPVTSNTLPRGISKFSTTLIPVFLIFLHWSGSNSTQKIFIFCHWPIVFRQKTRVSLKVLKLSIQTDIKFSGSFLLTYKEYAHRFIFNFWISISALSLKFCVSIFYVYPKECLGNKDLDFGRSVMLVGHYGTCSWGSKRAATQQNRRV